MLARLFVLVVALAVLPSAESYFRGDPVRMFKKLQFSESRSMWSDVLVGQAPVFGVNRQVVLKSLPAKKVPEGDELKLMFSFDNDKFLTPWFTVLSGERRLHTITFRFVVSGALIKELTWSTAYFLDDQHAEYYEPHMSKQHHPKHEDEIIIHYLWRHEVVTDTRGGLNFLFISGCLLTLLAVVAVALDSGGILTTRPLLVPKYASGKRLESLTLYTADNSSGLRQALGPVAPQDFGGQDDDNAKHA